MKPFIKWAGGKRWLTESQDFSLPDFSGKYLEPFVGGGAVFFHLQPERAVISDINRKLIETYKTISLKPKRVKEKLLQHQLAHNESHYYSERSSNHSTAVDRAAQFLYLNRTCWNGLYRENLRGEFNVPIGTKNAVYSEDEDFDSIAKALRKSEILCQDFEDTLDRAESGDLAFIDPPYTTAHNLNGFIKYNQRIFSWEDQLRLLKAAKRAKKRGATVIVTNANHSSLEDLYSEADEIIAIKRKSVISGKASGRSTTSELLIRL